MIARPPARHPARSYDEALERARAFAALDDASILPAAHTVLLQHGGPPLAVVLLRGFTQRSGPVCRVRTATARVRRERFRAADAGARRPRPAFDADRIADGCGAAGKRRRGTRHRLRAGRTRRRPRDFDGRNPVGLLRAVSRAFDCRRVAPDFALLQLPYGVSRALARIFALLPNFFAWWDPRERERQRPATAYPRFSTRALMQTLLVGDDVYAASQRRAQLAQRIVTVVNHCDPAVNNDAARHVSSAWSGWDRPGSRRRQTAPPSRESRHHRSSQSQCSNRTRVPTIAVGAGSRVVTSARRPAWRIAFAIAAAGLVSAGCANAPRDALPSSAGTRPSAIRAASSGKIEHVIIVVQENRSFDDLFQGYPGADTVASGKDSKGNTIALHAVSLAKRYDIDHSAQAMFEACDGAGEIPGTKCRMDAFDLERSLGGPRDPQYAYVPHDESKPYFDMAHEWVLADRYVPIANRRELRSASVHHRRPSTVERQRAVSAGVGLQRRTKELRSVPSSPEEASGRRSAPVSTTRRSATNWTRRT